MKYILTNGRVEYRRFPTSFHSSKYKEYYSSPRIFIENLRMDKNLTYKLRNDGVIKDALKILNHVNNKITEDTKVTWNGSKNCFVVNCDIPAIDIKCYVAVVKEIDGEKVIVPIPPVNINIQNESNNIQ